MIDLTTSLSIAPLPHRAVRKATPWGHELTWAHTHRYAARLLHIESGHSLGPCFHRQRDQTFHVVSGRVEIALETGDGALSARVMVPGDSLHVWPGRRYRLTAVETCDLLAASSPELDDVVGQERGEFDVEYPRPEWPQAGLQPDSFLVRRRLLVIAPHADDETFGCGGTIAKAKALGSEVYVIVVSVGDLDHYDQTYARVRGATRAAELAEAMRLLGVDAHTILFRDADTHMRVDRIPRRDLIARLERESDLALDRIQPDMVLLPAVSFNQDHEAVFKAVFAACRPHLAADKPFARFVLAYDQPQLGWNHTPFHPNFYVDISDYLDRKLAAYACHRSQVRPDPHHASLENVERLARLRGSEVSVRAAEAFCCHRCVV